MPRYKFTVDIQLYADTPSAALIRACDLIPRHAAVWRAQADAAPELYELKDDNATAGIGGQAHSHGKLDGYRVIHTIALDED